MDSEDAVTFHQLQMARRKTTKVAYVEELLDMGFSTRHVAGLLETSVHRVQTWRREKSGGFTEAMQIAHLLATTDLVRLAGHDPAAWFETPLSDSSEVTPMDLYPKDMVLLAELACGQTSAEKVLDIRDPGWRRRGPSKFEVFEASDGDLAIRLRDVDAG